MGQKLSVALTQCVMTMGGFTPNISISDRLTLNYDRPMFCGSLTELAKNLRAFSLSRIKDPGYTGCGNCRGQRQRNPGVDNDYANHPDQGSKTSATERSKNPVQINFNDLIGQPTWISLALSASSALCAQTCRLATTS
jgi:hypothetical protein